MKQKQQLIYKVPLSMKVEKLPTIGESETIKTRAQGRRLTLTQASDRHEKVDGMLGLEGAKTCGGLRRRRVLSMKECELTAKNIIAHKGASDKQRNLCIEFLKNPPRRQGCINSYYR